MAAKLMIPNAQTKMPPRIICTSVGVGPAAQIVLIKDASDGTVVGGKAFTPQPRAEVRDAGGNVLTIDSSSAVRVSFYSSPSRGSLSPVDGMIATLREGIVQFRGLAVDKAGSGYRLKYDFLYYEDEELVQSSVSTKGELFQS